MNYFFGSKPTKEEIGSLPREMGLEFVKQLRPVVYKEGEDTNYYGLVPDEVKELSKSLVKNGEVQINELCVCLALSIQQLEKKIEALESRLDDTCESIEEVENKLDEVVEENDARHAEIEDRLEELED